MEPDAPHAGFGTLLHDRARDRRMGADRDAVQHARYGRDVRIADFAFHVVRVGVDRERLEATTAEFLEDRIGRYVAAPRDASHSEALAQ